MDSIKKRRLLWLDDYRNPFDLKIDWLVFSPIGKNVEVIWVKNYKDFVAWITNNGLPDAICFDHDLGQDEADEAVKNGMSKKKARALKKGIKDGYDCAKWLVEYCMDNNKELPLYNIQSANPVGKENIDKLLTNFNKRS